MLCSLFGNTFHITLCYKSGFISVTTGSVDRGRLDMWQLNLISGEWNRHIIEIPHDDWILATGHRDVHFYGVTRGTKELVYATNLESERSFSVLFYSEETQVIRKFEVFNEFDVEGLESFDITSHRRCIDIRLDHVDSFAR